MVSRSLEKMMLIAIGLTTAVIIGVPVLLYAIDTMTTTQQIQYAHQTADTIFNATQQVDSGDVGELTIQVYVPSGFSSVPLKWHWTNLPTNRNPDLLTILPLNHQPVPFVCSGRYPLPDANAWNQPS